MEENLMTERKEMILSLMNEAEYVPMKIKELAALMDIPRERREDLAAVLDALIEEGKIAVSKKGKYQKADAVSAAGVFCAHPRGFGFVAVEGQEEDVFVPPDRIKDAMDGDTVQIKIVPAKGVRRAEAEITKVITRANQTVIGTFEKNKRFGFVIPDNPRLLFDIFIPEGKENGAV